MKNKEIDKILDEFVKKHGDDLLGYLLKGAINKNDNDEVIIEFKKGSKGVNHFVLKGTPIDIIAGICLMLMELANQDKEKAYQIFNEISKVDIRAKYQIAIMNFIGVGTVQNYVKAFEIFSELKGKSPWDMDKWIDSYMGEMYFYGLGVEQDKEKGLSLMENAWNEGIALDYKNIKKVLKDYYNS